jgi:hypothetical protein
MQPDLREEKRREMKRIIVLSMVFMMLVSLVGCCVGFEGGYDRGGGYEQGAHEQDGGHHKGGGHDEQH